MPIDDDVDESTDGDEDDIPVHLFTHCPNPTHCDLCVSGVQYMGGAMVKKLRARVSCTECYAALLAPIHAPVDSLISVKQYEAALLLTPSTELLRVLLELEKLSRQSIHTNTMSSIIANSHSYFPSLDAHDMATIGGIDGHKLKLLRMVVRWYNNLRKTAISKGLSMHRSQFGVRQRSQQLLNLRHL